MSFAAGSLNGAVQTITVPIDAHTTYDAPETFTVGLSSPLGATIGTPASTVVTILDVLPRADLDGDRKSDLSVWRATNGYWYWLTSSSSYNYTSGQSYQFGNQSLGDVPIVADLDGDKKMDLVVWRASTGTWYWLTSSSGYTAGYSASLGTQGDQPMAADLDGDGRSDLVVWHPATGTFSWLTSSSGYAAGASQQLGNASLGDIPMLGDIDGDGKADLIVWRASNGTWYWLMSSTGYTVGDGVQWGAQGDQPLLGDFDGDGRMDLAVWRPSNGTWYWLTSSSGYDPTQAVSEQFGNSSDGDQPIIADMDGDGRADLVVWRASTGTWYWLTSSSGYTAGGSKQWGNASLGDIPLPGPGGGAR